MINEVWVWFYGSLSSMELCGFVPLDWNLLFPAARATEKHLN